MWWGRAVGVGGRELGWRTECQNRVKRRQLHSALYRRSRAKARDTQKPRVVDRDRMTSGRGDWRHCRELTGLLPDRLITEQFPEDRHLHRWQAGHIRWHSHALRPAPAFCLRCFPSSTRHSQISLLAATSRFSCTHDRQANGQTCISSFTVFIFIINFWVFTSYCRCTETGETKRAQMFGQNIRF